MTTSTMSLTRATTGRWSRLADYWELTKPRIALLVLVVVAATAFIVRDGWPAWNLVANVLLGTALVSASGSALNQWLERKTDALMDRTAPRPLPGGRLREAEVLRFATATLVTGLGVLWLAVNGETALLGLFTWTLYVWVYTPLKTRTCLNTAVGAVAGAMPILIGWAAVRLPGESWLNVRMLSLFTLVFLWQFPHFMAIAWLYRKQYGSAGLKMLPVVDATGRRAGIQAFLAAALLLPISLLPVLGGSDLGALLFAVTALLLGAGQLACALWFLTRRNDHAARRLLQASLVYLPLLFLLLVCVSWR